MFLSVNGGARMEQAGNQVCFGARDIALYDLSRPWQTIHSTGPASMRVVMLTFPRASVPMTRAEVAPLVGAAIPRRLPGRGLIAQFLIGLTDLAGIDEQKDGPELAVVLRECAVGLIRRRLDQPDGITPRTRQLLQVAGIRAILRRHLGDPAFDIERLAEVANLSSRHIYKLFQDTGSTPMQLLKRLRLEAARHSLLDPSLATTPVKSIMAAHGYVRADQFARDFRQLFGVSPTQARGLPGQQPAGRPGPARGGTPSLAPNSKRE
jgi:AraC-like DNA-binding protein